MNVLVLNCGSSSVKFRLFQMNRSEVLSEGRIEKIGSCDSFLVCRIPGKDETKEYLPVKTHKEAVDLVLKAISDPKHKSIDDVQEIEAVGHRVVHGGDAFSDSVLINEEVLQKIKACIPLAPLHNPPNIMGIEASLWLMPFARQVAVFDTAFHQTMEAHAYLYALPYEWYEKKRIRRYGFHGTSHRYVAEKAVQFIGNSEKELKLITCHLGNGSSITAIKNSKSVETSMGFTPLEGIVMGTRCGDVDPAIPLHIMKEEGLAPEEMDVILTQKSGLLGITGGDYDLRTIEEKAKAGSARHFLALKIFAHRVKKYIGAYAAIMGGLDGLVFTGGIGENSSTIRSMICEDLEFLGIELNGIYNKENHLNIERGETPVMVIPTNEELAIAQETMCVLLKEKQQIEMNEILSCQS
ncbi:acetate/propionate family kinase [bacterium]